jgi:hypothetical protein
MLDTILKAVIDALIKYFVAPIISWTWGRWHHVSREWLTSGAQIALRACDGNYVRIDADGNLALHATDRHVSEWAKFEIVHSTEALAGASDKVVRYGDKIAIRQTSRPTNFIGVNYSGEKELVARVGWAKEWETFLILPMPCGDRWKKEPVRFGQPITLRSFNGEFVRYNRDGSQELSATAKITQEWEGFVVIRPEQPM